MVSIRTLVDESNPNDFKLQISRIHAALAAIYTVREVTKQSQDILMKNMTHRRQNSSLNEESIEEQSKTICDKLKMLWIQELVSMDCLPIEDSHNESTICDTIHSQRMKTNDHDINMKTNDDDDNNMEMSRSRLVESIPFETFAQSSIGKPNSYMERPIPILMKQCQNRYGSDTIYQSVIEKSDYTRQHENKFVMNSNVSKRKGKRKVTENTMNLKDETKMNLSTDAVDVDDSIDELLMADFTTFSSSFVEDQLNGNMMNTRRSSSPSLIASTNNNDNNITSKVPRFRILYESSYNQLIQNDDFQLHSTEDPSIPLSLARYLVFGNKKKFNKRKDKWNLQLIDVYVNIDGLDYLFAIADICINTTSLFDISHAIECDVLSTRLRETLIL